MVTQNPPRTIATSTRHRIGTAAIELLNVGDLAGMKVITVRCVDTGHGLAYHVMVATETCTTTQTMTGPEVAEFFREQASLHEHAAQIVADVRKRRSRRACA